MQEPTRRRVRRRLRIGKVWIDVLNFTEVLEEIEHLVDEGRGGAVFTPNVDHIVKAESDEAFRRAYEHASLSLADGTPLLWVARLLGCPLPGRIAGSDLLMPLMELAARRRWRVYLLGSVPEVAGAAAKLLTDRLGVAIVGWDCPRIGADGSDLTGGTIAKAAAARPDLVLVALGATKQEILIHGAAETLGPAVVFGIGGSLDFLVGRYKRAPRWMSRAGLEWSFRLFQEPRRLWRRYLVEDTRFALVVLRTLLSPKSGRTKTGPPFSVT
jgi:N-acetylglucosaminyldiphosphoundecaprenol N-acetyl-beta-D-mannosaminyltransferase